MGIKLKKTIRKTIANTRNYKMPLCKEGKKMHVYELEKFKQMFPEAQINTELNTATIEKKLHNLTVKVIVHVKEDFYSLRVSLLNLTHEPSKNTLKLLRVSLGDVDNIESSKTHVTIYSNHSKVQFGRITKQIDTQFKLIQNSLLLVTEKPISFFNL